MYHPGPVCTNKHRRPGYKVFLGDLPHDCDHRTLLHWTAQYDVSDVRFVARDPGPLAARDGTGAQTVERVRNYAIITFNSPDTAALFVTWARSWGWTGTGAWRWLTVKYCEYIDR